MRPNNDRLPLAHRNGWINTPLHISRYYRPLASWYIVLKSHSMKETSFTPVDLWLVACLSAQEEKKMMTWILTKCQTMQFPGDDKLFHYVWTEERSLDEVEWNSDDIFSIFFLSYSSIGAPKRIQSTIPTTHPSPLDTRPVVI